MLRPLCTKLATRAIHWRGSPAAAISYRIPQLSMTSSRAAADQGFTSQTRTLATTPPPSSSGPPIQKSVDKSQEAIDKAEQLHKELNELIKAQKDRQNEEAQRPFGSGIVQFFKASKPEIEREMKEALSALIANVYFFQLLLIYPVLLAYQIHKMRAGIKKLLADQEEKKAEIDRLRGLLATLSREETTSDNTSHNIFTMTLAEKCADVVRKMFEESEKRAGYGWILGRKLASRDSLEAENLVEEIQTVVSTEIQSVIGDAAYTAEELKERRVAALKEEDVGNRSVGRDAQLGGLMDILEEVHKADLPDGDNAESNVDAASGKVRRTRYAI
eukprot:scaffold21131_cov194-Skeletonema_marinoi.AAC.6